MEKVAMDPKNYGLGFKSKDRDVIDSSLIIMSQTQNINDDGDEDDNDTDSIKYMVE